jgi:hypothetical protein
VVQPDLPARVSVEPPAEEDPNVSRRGTRPSEEGQIAGLRRLLRSQQAARSLLIGGVPGQRATLLGEQHLD